jgi:transposase
MPERTVRHLCQFHRMTFVVFRQRRFFCGHCGKIVAEHVEWVRPCRRHTVMFEQLCASLCDKFAVTDVAEQMKVDKSALYEIDAHWIGRRNEEHRVSTEGVKYIGIDEIMVRRSDVKVLVKVPVPVKVRCNRKARRGMKKRRIFERKWVWVVRPAFATVIYDLQTGRILAIAEGRSCQVASRLLRSLGKEVLANVKAVCIDMAACYKKAVRRCLPKAAIVFDRFHVKTYVNEAVDEVRKAAQADADKDDRKFIFNQRWLLLKSEPEERDKWRLDSLFDLNKDLALAYQLKDQFDAIFELEGKAEAEKRLNSYISYCRRSRLVSFNKLARRLARWKPHILSYFDHPITNGMVEGMNNVVKRVLYRGFGYRNMNYFFGKVRVATGDIPTMAELGVTIAENSYQKAS